MAMDGQTIHTDIFSQRPTAGFDAIGDYDMKNRVTTPILVYNEFRSLIHAIARAGHLVHSTIMWIALKLYPEFIKHKDGDGNSVLHIIVANNIYYRSRVLDHHRHHQQQHQQSATAALIPEPQVWERSMLSMILDKDRALASVPDKRGRLPLHLLLVHYGQTKEQYEDLKKQHNGFDSESGFTLNIQESINEILNAYPSAIEITDPSSGLLPFMLAASVRHMPLDIIFDLLIRNPTLVTSSCVTVKRKRDTDSENLHPPTKKMI
jgi:hypothetical protein